MSKSRLDQYFARETAFYSLVISDSARIGRIANAITNAAFRRSRQDAARIDLRYRLTASSAGRPVERFYMTKFGDLLWKDIVYTPSNGAWLSDLWKDLGVPSEYRPVGAR